MFEACRPESTGRCCLLRDGRRLSRSVQDALFALKENTQLGLLWSAVPLAIHFAKVHGELEPMNPVDVSCETWRPCQKEPNLIAIFL